MVSEALRRFREKAKEKQGGFEKDHSIFPFWNLPFDGSATLRFIPFEDELTETFYTEKKIIRMNFLDPNDETKIVRFEAPCYEMYSRDKKCPILQPVRDLYQEAKGLKNAGDTTEAERLEKVAGAHWIKPIFYYQGFVIKPGMNEAESPENPIRIFPLLKQIHNLILAKLMSEEEDGFEILPTGEFDLDDVNALLTEGSVPEDEIERLLTKFEGINFILRKTKQGDYASYVTSSWAGNPTMLNEEQMEAVHTHGLHDLRKRLPEQPTEEQYELMTEMVNISIGRLLGQDDGFWDPEWEKAGLKPKKDRNTGGGDSDDKPASTSRRGAGAGQASKLRSQLSKARGGDSDASASGTVSDVMNKVKRTRGAKAAAPADDAPAADVPAAESEGKAAPPKSALAAKIKGGLKKTTVEA